MNFALSAAAATQVFDESNGTNWPEAMIAITAMVAGIAMITIVASIVIWQGLGTWRARMQIAREQAYQKLAEEMSVTQHTTMTEIQKIASDVSDLRVRTSELERMLKEV